MYSKIADENRKALKEQVKRLSREERLQIYVRHSKRVIQLYNAARRPRLADHDRASDDGLGLD